MTNFEIIAQACALANIAVDTEVDTYAGWSRKGYTVKRGEHAVFKTKIWKPCKRKKDAEQTENAEQTEANSKRLILVNAAFFTDEQVEKKEVVASS